MPTCRLYRLDEAGKFDRSEGIEAADDSQAMMLARAMEHPFMCEVWAGAALSGALQAFHALTAGGNPRFEECPQWVDFTRKLTVC